MQHNLKNILMEHNALDAGGGNHLAAGTSAPGQANFDGKIFYDTSDESHYVYYDGKYRLVGGETPYGGLVREKKDENGAFEIVEKLTMNGSVLHRSTLSDPDENGWYKKRTIESNIGKPNARIDTFTLSYDEDGDLISEKAN